MKDFLTQGYQPKGNGEIPPPPCGGSSVMSNKPIEYVYINMDQRCIVSKDDLEAYAQRNPYGWWTHRGNQFNKHLMAYGTKNYTHDNVNAVAIFYGVYSFDRNFSIHDTIRTSR